MVAGRRAGNCSNDNLSWNCGCEGPTKAAEIIQLRQRQMRESSATILLLSAGTPMLLAGDEFGRTQRGQQQRLPVRTMRSVGSIGASSKLMPTCSGFSSISSNFGGCIRCSAVTPSIATKKAVRCTSPGMVSSWGSRTGPRSLTPWRCTCTGERGRRRMIFTSLPTHTGRAIHLSAAPSHRVSLVSLR